MRKHRFLVQDAWYKVRTAVNNREPLFRRRQVAAIFYQALAEARERFSFEIRGLVLVEERLSFYIKPADGQQLLAIMQWLKQTFSVRFNLRRGRSGHVWGDRYWSQVLEGEPPEEAEEVDWEAVKTAAETGVLSSGRCSPDGVSPSAAENPAEGRFSPQNPARSPPPPG
jgi:REP element-mobilizing transposase RayT